jgi:hypothetical protein
MCIQRANILTIKNMNTLVSPGFPWAVFLFAVLGLYLKPLHQPYFVFGIFEIGLHGLFAWAGFELQPF